MPAESKKKKVGEKSPTIVINHIGKNLPSTEYLLYPFRVRTSDVPFGSSILQRNNIPGGWTWRFVTREKFSELQALYIVQALAKNPRRGRYMAKKFAEEHGLIIAD